MKRSSVLLIASSFCLLFGCAGSHLQIEESPMTSTVTPFLMFQGENAEEAMHYYTDAFTDGRVVEIKRYGPGGHLPEGTVELGEFEIHGQRVRCTDSPPVHGFDFTPSMSLFVECASEDEFDALVGRLADGGSFLMPVDNYGFSRKFAFFKDQFGVSWQVNLADAPASDG